MLKKKNLDKAWNNIIYSTLNLKNYKFTSINLFSKSQKSTCDNIRKNLVSVFKPNDIDINKKSQLSYVQILEFIPVQTFQDHIELRSLQFKTYIYIIIIVY